MSNDVEWWMRGRVWLWIGIVVTIIWVVGLALAIYMERESPQTKDYYASQLGMCREHRNPLLTYESCTESVEASRQLSQQLGDQIASFLLGLGLVTATVFWAIVGLIVWVVRR
jgi:type IV secretory pathway TrbD component